MNTHVLPYNEGGLDGGMFNPHHLDALQRANLEYVQNHAPIATQKLRNLMGANQNLSGAYPNEVLYDQAYINNMQAEINRLQNEVNTLNTRLHSAHNEINSGNTTIYRLDNLVTELKKKLLLK